MNYEQALVDLANEKANTERLEVEIYMFFVIKKIFLLCLFSLGCSC